MPEHVVFYCQEQLETYKTVTDKISSTRVAHIDATGSLIKRSGKKILVYSVCAFVPIKGIKCLPLVCLLYTSPSPRD